MSSWPRASAGGAFVRRSSRLSLGERADADGKCAIERSSSQFTSIPERQLCRARTSLACCRSSYSSFASGISSLLGESMNCRSELPTFSAMRHARVSSGLCTATRTTAAKSGLATFAAASFAIKGSSTKNESPAASVTARMMLSGQACRVGAKSTWSSADSPSPRSFIAPITPAKGSGSNRSYPRSGLMNSFDSPKSTITRLPVPSHWDSKYPSRVVTMASGKYAWSCWLT